MKKTFLARRNAILSPSGVPLGAALLALVVILAFVRILIPNLFDQTFAPVFAFGNNIDQSVHRFMAGFQNSQLLATENQTLMDENQALNLQNRTLAEQAANATALLGTGVVPRGGMVAGVVARPPESPYDTLLISGGTSDGITVGMEAFGPGGVPVGAVTAATNLFARVTLFSASGAHVSGWIGKNHIPVTLYGAGGGAFTAQLPSASGAQIGDTVFVSGPGSLPLGTLQNMQTNSSSAMSTLQITPLVNPFTITEVRLIDEGSPFAHLMATSTPQ